MHRRRDVRGRRGKSNLSGRSKTESSITGHEGDADDDRFARRERSLSCGAELSLLVDLTRSPCRRGTTAICGYR
jgi:hypothetical protein